MLNMLFQHLQKQTTSTKCSNIEHLQGRPAPPPPPARPGCGALEQRSAASANCSKTTQNRLKPLKIAQNHSEPLRIAQNSSNKLQNDSKSRESGEFEVILCNLESLLFEKP